MGTQRVNYRQGSDTGERDDANSISPIEDGERVISTVANRPGENIRNRTESVRSNLEDQMYLSDTDMRWIIRGGHITGDYMVGDPLPAVVRWTPQELGAGNDPWDPVDPERGSFEVDSTLILEGILSPGRDYRHLETFYCETTTPFPPENATLTLESRYQAAAGGDTIRVRWRYDDDAAVPFPSGYLSVYTTGEPIHVINVDVAGDGSVTLNEVYNALNLDSAILKLVDLTYTGATPAIDTAQTAPTEGERLFNREVQRELHRLRGTTIDAFFAAGVTPYLQPDLLKDGDTLGILYPYIKDPEAFFGPHSDPLKVGGRRQATLTNNALPTTPVEVDVSQLFNSTVHPEYVSQAIPICKRIGQDLVFIDGTVIVGELDPLDPLYPPGGVKFGEHGYTVDRIVSGASSILVPLSEFWYGATPPSCANPDTVQDVFNAIIRDLASTVAGRGTSLIGETGNPAPPGPSSLLWPVPLGSIHDVFLAVQASTNERAALGFDETILGSWTFDASAGFNTVVSTWYHQNSSPTHELLYIYNPSGAVAETEVYFESIRVYYESTSGSFIYLLGCDIEVAGPPIQVRAAKDDSLTGHIMVYTFSNRGIATWQLRDATANVTYTIGGADPDAYFELLGLNAELGKTADQRFSPMTFNANLSAIGATNTGMISLQSSKDNGGGGNPWAFAHVPASAGAGSKPDTTLYYITEDYTPGYESGSNFIRAYNCIWDPTVPAWRRVSLTDYAAIDVFTMRGSMRYTKNLAMASPSWCSSSRYDAIGSGGWDDIHALTPVLAGNSSSPFTDPTLDMWGPSFRHEGSIAASSARIFNEDIDWRNRHVEVRAFISTDDITAVDALGKDYRELSCPHHVSAFFGDNLSGRIAGVWGVQQYDLRSLVFTGTSIAANFSGISLGVDPSNGIMRIQNTDTTTTLYYNIYLTPSLKTTL